MKLLKLDWTHHDGKPIFSVDVHPDGNKFATGGQGDDSGRVVIWNMKPMLSVEAEMDKNCPKILCQLDNHLACVNCVRWSMNGVLLASGGDDKLIMIWKRGKGPSAVFGNSGITKTTESWRCIQTLRGHSGDVLDLAWSPQDRWLASCSVDNTIIVWNMQSMPLMVAMLKGHTGLVKGVTWDPVGKFMASQSDDRSVKIWKTSDWTCQQTITEPFEDCTGTTHVLRLSWSPDGLYLVSAHAMNGGGPTAQIIEREGFKCDKDFVGHHKAVTCVRFHNSILKRQAPKTNKSQQYCCLAMGSRDRSLSIWLTALQRPLVVIHDLFQDSILDLSWSTDNNILLACSKDGTVALLQFGPNEFGTPLSVEDKNSLYQRMYGKSANIDMSAQQEKEMIIEYPELVNVGNDEHKSTTNNNSNGPLEINIENNNIEIKMNNEHGGNGKNENSNNSSLTPIKAAIHKQIETRTKDGKRRITPMFIPLDPDINDTPTTELSSSSRMTSQIYVEKLQSTTTTTHQSAAPTIITAGTTNCGQSIEINTSVNVSTITTTIGDTATTVTNKRDIETVKYSENAHIDNRLTKLAPRKTNAMLNENNDNLIKTGIITDTAVHSSALLTTVTPITDSANAVKQSSSSSSTSAGTSAAAATATSTIVAATNVLHKPNEMITPFTTKFNILNAGRAIPLKGQHVKNIGEYKVQIINGSVTTAFGSLSKITCFSSLNPSKSIWEQFIGSPLVNFCISIKFVLACSADGTLRFFDIRTGIFVLPIIKLPTAAIQCGFSFNSELGGVVTECGSVRIWNMYEQNIYIMTSCMDILSGSIIAHFHISELGVAFILLSNGSSFSYSKKLESWLVVNSRDPIIRYGVSTAPVNPNKNIRIYPLNTVQTTTINYQPNARNFTSGNDLASIEWQNSAKLSFIENQIKICESLNSAIELEHWYSLLATNLANYGGETRIRILLDDLLGSTPLSATNNRKTSKNILGVSKHKLLRKVLDSFKIAPRWQRIYMEYSEQLNEAVELATATAAAQAANTISAIKSSKIEFTIPDDSLNDVNMLGT